MKPLKLKTVKDDLGKTIVDVKEVRYSSSIYYIVSYLGGDTKMVPYSTKHIEEFLLINS